MSHHKLIGKLKTVVLTRADLSEATGEGAHIVRGMFLPTDDPDIRIRVPVVPNLEMKILRAVEREQELKKLGIRKSKIRGKLDMGSWHGDLGDACGTVHCRLGWAEFLGGAAATRLRNRFYPGVIGALVYLVSTGHVPDFSAVLKPAVVLKDIRRRALAEKRRKKAFTYKHIPKKQPS